MVHVMLPLMLMFLYFYISTFWSVSSVLNMAVFCSSFILCFPSMVLSNFPSDSEMVQVAPIITGITFTVTSHVHSVCIVRSLYCRIFLASVSWLHFCLMELQLTIIITIIICAKVKRPAGCVCMVVLQATYCFVCVCACVRAVSHCCSHLPP